MTEIPLAGKRVVIREDFNVPMEYGSITDDTRLRSAIPTINAAVTAGARVMLLSHLGRPKEGEFDPRYSLEPVANALADLMATPVRFEFDWMGGIEQENGSIVMCENVRFLKGENANNENLARRLAALADIFVNDAFATAHRAQASTYGIAQFAPIACAGPLLSAELDALSVALRKPARPMVAIVGGAKVSTKLALLESLSVKVDQLIVGGGIANTFLKAAGFEIGNSLHEPDMIETAKQLLNGGDIPIPTDLVCGKNFNATAKARVVAADAVQKDDMILDVGPQTAKTFAKILEDSQTIIWNGPVGVFEFDQFSAGTKILAEAAANSTAYSIAGGGDTIAAIVKFGVADRISYISTGGGAFLEFVEGKILPAVDILERRDQ
ncbi:MAG TPA: phosphoglycerate kinase [Gammaproteobacteria bacterium]|nr:phosphoglycerate kinase [Gammaproteobacteria bacterium]